MAIQSYNKISTKFSMIALANIVMLLLVFFILTSTVISPNAIRLKLPAGSGRIISKQSTTVYISDPNSFFVNKIQASEHNLIPLLSQSLIGQTEGVIVIRASQDVPLQKIVSVIDAVSKMNKLLNTHHTVILATQPQQK
jgi:biopolymer transport protein ExbD